MSDTVTRGSVYLGAQQIVALLSMVAVHTCAARYLGPVAYGHFAVVLALLSILTLSLLVGIPNAVSKFTAEDRGSAGTILRKGLLVQSGIALGLCGLLYLAASSLAEFLGNPNLAPLIQFASLSLPCTGLAYVYIHSLNGIRAFAKQAVVLAASNVFKAIGILAFLFFGFGLEGAVLGIVCAAVVTLLVSATFCRGVEGRQRCETRKLTIFGAQLAITYLTVEIWNQSDLLMLQILGTQSEDVGLLGVVNTLRSILDTIFLPLFTMLFPIASQCLAVGDASVVAHYMQKGVTYVFLLVSPLVVITFFIGQDILGMVYGSEYLTGAFAVAPLLMSTLFYILYELLDTFICGSGNAFLSLRIAASLLLTHIGLNWFLIPRYGIQGVVITNIVMSLLATLAMWIAVKRLLTLRIDWLSIGKIIICSLGLSTPFLLWQAETGLGSVLMAVVCLGGYLCLLVTWNVIDTEAISRMKTMGKYVAYREV
ncbi:MAG: succinoglycan biosynthesis protein ExoP [Nitrospirales bacterium]|nr:MAG: succinoglycan biosynthesis protein ExoP [Nitrospirales bacterium]